MNEKGLAGIISCSFKRSEH